MICNLKTIAKAAQQGGYAVGAFNTPNLESVKAVLDAAERLQSPVILMHAEVHETVVPLSYIGPIMLEQAKCTSVPVCVHLDHGVSFDILMQAMRLGFTSVMYDGSALSYKENLVNTKEVVRIAHAMGVSVEAELGRIQQSETGSAHPGHESLTTADSYTDPTQAEEFVGETGVDALAIAFGTAHGIYTTKPVLDFDRISLIRNRVSVPLVMHGGSGIDRDGFHTAIHNGITKINYYTYMAKAGADAVRAYLEKTKDAYFHDIANVAADCMSKDVENALSVFLMQ